MQNAKIGIFIVFLQSVTRNIMNLGLRQIFTIVAAIVIAINVPAQEIPLLPQDASVTNGLMPNGMAYYIVVNPAEKDVADFALVQKTGKLTFPDSTCLAAEALAHDALSFSNRLRKSPAGYMKSHGVLAGGKEDFAKVTDDATIFRFPDISLKSNSLDSLLLMLMDIADRANYIDNDVLKKWYAPADQAVVVSGDIDPKTVAAKLTNMSYMIPAGESAVRPEYAAQDSCTYSTEAVAGKPSITRISAAWTSERAPREYMNTVQSEIFKMSMNTLGAAAVNRMKKALRAADVPVAEAGYEHTCSSSHPYDDAITITAVVASENADKASEIMADVMASIDMYGVGTNEYRTAESSYIQRLEDESARPVTLNSEYVDRCVNAFLYNASLASPKERLAFHTSRNLPDTMRRRLFNGIAKAVIDTTWSTSEPKPYADLTIPDTLDRPAPPTRVKLKSSRREPVSNGTMWTFSNGFRVIYRKMASDRMYYGMALNGGYGGVRGLEKGEGAFFADYFSTCRVAGMEAGDFKDALRNEGVSMDVEVGVSTMMISGSLPDDRMPLLLRSLLAIANERTSDEASFDYYNRSEYLSLDNKAGSLYARMAAVDSIICPDNNYSAYKVKGVISHGFRARAEAFYEARFGRMNDGILVLAGNMDEDRLKKILLEYVGGFRTEGGASINPPVRYQAVSGTSTYTVDGLTDNVDVVISSRLPYTMDNHIASEFASMALERELAKVLEGSEFILSHENWIYPEERMNLLISLPGAPIAALADVRSVLSRMDDMEISEGVLKEWKAMMKHQMALDMKSPAYWIDAIALRYLVGKDLTTNYEAKIDAVTPAKVKAVLSLLDNGCKVEYVTIKK